MTPHKKAQECLFRALAGDDLTRADFIYGVDSDGAPLYCLGSFANENAMAGQSSGNILAMAQAAWMIGGKPSAQDREDFLRWFTGLDPCTMNETNSPSVTYAAWIAVAALSINARLSEVPGGIAKPCRFWLLAVWALCALQASHEQATRFEHYYEGSRFVPPVRPHGYVGGLYLTTSSMRAVSDAQAGQMDADMMPALLTKALGLPIKKLNKKQREGFSAQCLTAAWGDKWPVDPQSWGLAPNERTILQRFVIDPSREDAERIIKWLDPMTPIGNVKRLIVRAGDGLEDIYSVQDPETGGVKRTQDGWTAASFSGATMRRYTAGSGPDVPVSGVLEIRGSSKGWTVKTR